MSHHGPVLIANTPTVPVGQIARFTFSLSRGEPDADDFIVHLTPIVVTINTPCSEYTVQPGQSVVIDVPITGTIQDSGGGVLTANCCAWVNNTSIVAKAHVVVT
ncbi:MAG: hypothetical protein ACR2HJ_12320 [Fimbriimonadales bacterium]